MRSSDSKLPLCKFGGHRYCGSADIYFFHVSHDHIIKRSRDFEGRKCRYKVLHLSRDHVIKKSSDLVDKVFRQ